MQGCEKMEWKKTNKKFELEFEGEKYVTTSPNIPRVLTNAHLNALSEWAKTSEDMDTFDLKSLGYRAECMELGEKRIIKIYPKEA